MSEEADALLSWFEKEQRALPWRTPARDAYRVWVSEVMLQQTRVDTVLGYHDAFLARFPTVEALAAADVEDVMKAWEGLGYYRRARLLHEGARVVVAEHGGKLPQDVDALRRLPGFGPYTAGAVASLAHGIAAPAIDGNVLRVVARLLALEHDVTRPQGRRAVEAWVRAHQPPHLAGAFNEALMELGATRCTPTHPRCDACPLASACRARAENAALRYPRQPARRKPVEARVALAVARRGESWLLEKRTEGLLAGTWGLPWEEVGPQADAAAALGLRVASLTGAPVRVSPTPVARGKHVFTHRRWAMEAYVVETDGPQGDWLDPSEVALGTAHRKLMARLRKL